MGSADLLVTAEHGPRPFGVFMPIQPALMSRVFADETPAGDEARPMVSTDYVEHADTAKFAVLLVEDNRADILIVEEAIALYGLPIELHVLRRWSQGFRIYRATRP